jgi:hypothetical protein
MLVSAARVRNIARIGFAAPAAGFSHTQAFLLVSSVVLFSRLPFVNTSLGSDADVYRTALAARHIAATGTYQFSRFPGFPVQEYVFAVLTVVPGPVMNLVSAVLSAVGAGFFTLILRRLELPNPIALSFAFAFTPIVFVSSTTSQDYVWASTCILAGLWFSWRRPWLAGLALGVATGCRFTSLAMFVPVAILIAGMFPARRMRALLQFAGATFLTVILLFLPMILTPRPGSGVQIPVDTGFVTLVYRATAGVWGVPGFIVLAAFAVWATFTSMLHRNRGSAGVRNLMALPSMLGAGMFLVIFLRYPYEAAYLVPAVPLTLILLAPSLTRKAGAALAFVMLLSSFTFGVTTAEQPESVGYSNAGLQLSTGDKTISVDPFSGPVRMEYERREARRRLLDRLYAFADTVGSRTVVIAGWLVPQIRYEVGDAATRGGATFVYALRQDALQSSVTQGLRVYYLKGMDIMNHHRYGVNPAVAGARLLDLEGPVR